MHQEGSSLSFCLEMAQVELQGSSSSSSHNMNPVASALLVLASFVQAALCPRLLQGPQAD